MISVVTTEGTMFRSFGWVQDPSNFRNLCNVVAVFDENSSVHQLLRDVVLPNLVSKEDGLEDLIDTLNRRPLKINYSKLVGFTTIPRSQSRCNAIIQAAVKGQGRDFIGDWPADNFVRWAHAFGFLKYDYGEDAFEITAAGKRLVAARPGNIPFPFDQKDEMISKEEEEELMNAILAYPPAIRILSLLSEEGTHLSKFEIGRKLGFIGEGGFTSLPQKLLLHALATTEVAGERSKMRMDWDGSSDKYARMIGKWLTKLGLLTQKSKYFDVETPNGIKQEMIGQSFCITAKGYQALLRSNGRGKYRKIPRNVCFEMLGGKGNDREFLRMRRAFILKVLSDAKKEVKIEEIKNYLSEMKIDAKEETIRDDVKGLISIGLQIESTDKGYLLKDELNDFTIPIPKHIKPTDFEELKQELREELKTISHEYLSLIDLAYDSKQNRLFEMKVMQLLTEECGFQGMHLGGSRRPDGVIYTENFSVIIDTKAYTKGYNLPISDADEMERYVHEFCARDLALNPNGWWEEFPNELKETGFMFVAGHFKGNYQAQIDRISHVKGCRGVARSVVDLLRLAECIRSGKKKIESLADMLYF